MKINVEVDCTPEEARRFMGLPDLSPLHERYVGKLMEAMDRGVTPEMVESLMRSWAPMNEAGLNLWKNLLDPSGKRG